MERHSTLFFSDGKRRIDFVLVYKSNLHEGDKLNKFETYIENLQKSGLNIEIEKFTVDPSVSFVKIHAPESFVDSYADICDVDLACRNQDYRPPYKTPPNFMATPLTRPKSEDDISRRAESPITRIPTAATTAEVILIVYKLLTKTKFGTSYGDYGLSKLKKENILIDAYPLHEGPYEWTEYGKLSDRQLLAKFWGNSKCWYKAQPLNFIDKYFGSEFGFYFAWLGYYVKMLGPMAALSIICITYGVVTIDTSHNARSKEICQSSLIMCPRCHYQRCKYERLRSSCMQSHLTYLFDNPATITFAIIISFWSTVFMEFWQRSEAILQLQWNVKSLEHDTVMRPEYIEKSDSERYSPILLAKEPHVSFKRRCVGYTITIFSIFFLLFLMVLAALGVMVYRISVDFMLIRDSTDDIVIGNTRMIASATGACMNATIIFIFKAVFKKLSLWLTDLENHRTQHAYDNSYIYKSYSLAFVNNYAAVFYIAFFKGRFFTHPGDMGKWTFFGGLGADICAPTGCILDLSISLVIIMMSKMIVNNFIQIILPIIIGVFNMLKAKVIRTEGLPLYEIDYLMAPTEQYFLVDEYLDMVIQYGFVVFFVAGFPLAPLLAFLNNILEIRVDASKVTKHFRRPIPNRVSGLGAWFGILQATTYVGVVTNALVIAFTSSFAKHEFFNKSNRGGSGTFLNTSISAFAVSDFEILQREMVGAPKICYYPGRRYPPDHVNKYEPSTDHYVLLATRLSVVFIFEHIVIFLKGILAYAIPDVPTEVTKNLAIQDKKNKDMRMKVLNEEYMKKRRESGLIASFKPINIS
ncbi:unnamed protein product [Phaedon cochleariae]|uniref:Anoctamin n=1 Tax=Phaedon cochleariae TaxID=80249 RepID=A0A9P0DJ37_PHACE|nr:unnamed protein product [Phaedon cochleariae]